MYLRVQVDAVIGW
jgi:hypothetical protein